MGETNCDDVNEFGVQKPSLAQRFRNLGLPKADRILREAGVLDSSGVHTKAGRNLAWSFLFEKYKEELADFVAEQIAEDRAAAKSKK